MQTEVVSYARQVGERLRLETTVDDVGNVVIRKPAAAGYESLRGVILQAHLDMVPQRSGGSDHDFCRDSIRAYIDHGWVRARGTTLGADNGIGVAAALAVLEEKDVSHGPLEVLLTVDEETGMTGAFGLQPGVLQGDFLLNLDSEEEGSLYVGCSGGVDIDVLFNCSREPLVCGYQGLKIEVEGLRGGHSGLDIHLGQGNASLICAGLLKTAQDRFGLRLAEIAAGNMRNAIPREAVALVALPAAEVSRFRSFIDTVGGQLCAQLQGTDPRASIRASDCQPPARVMAAEGQENLLAALTVCPNGVLAWDNKMSVVLTSSNLALVKSTPDQVHIACLTRSAIDAERDAAAEKIADNFSKHGAKVTRSGAYPGWAPANDGQLLAMLRDAYAIQFGKLPEVKVVHAGLECGILGAHYPHWQMVSFGPTIRSPHSPDERVEIASVARFWDYLSNVLQQIPDRA